MGEKLPPWIVLVWDMAHFRVSYFGVAARERIQVGRTALLTRKSRNIRHKTVKVSTHDRKTKGMKISDDVSIVAKWI